MSTPAAASPFRVAPGGTAREAIERWRQPEGVRTREVTWEDPLESLQALVSAPGRAVLERIAAGELPPPPIALLLGFAMSEVGDGSVSFELHPGEHQYNPIGTVHGGVLATLLDSAMGCAVQSTLPAGTGYGTSDLQVRYTRPVLAGTSKLTCRGEVVHRGRRVVTAEGRVTDADGRLYAHGTTACQLFELPSG